MKPHSTNFDPVNTSRYTTDTVPSTLNFVKNVGDLKFIRGKVIIAR